MPPASPPSLFSCPPSALINTHTERESIQQAVFGVFGADTWHCEPLTPTTTTPVDQYRRPLNTPARTAIEQLKEQFDMSTLCAIANEIAPIPIGLPPRSTNTSNSSTNTSNTSNTSNNSSSPFLHELDTDSDMTHSTVPCASPTNSITSIFSSTSSTSPSPCTTPCTSPANDFLRPLDPPLYSLAPSWSSAGDYDQPVFPCALSYPVSFPGPRAQDGGPTIPLDCVTSDARRGGRERTPTNVVEFDAYEQHHFRGYGDPPGYSAVRLLANGKIAMSAAHNIRHSMCQFGPVQRIDFPKKKNFIFVHFASSQAAPRASEAGVVHVDGRVFTVQRKFGKVDRTLLTQAMQKQKEYHEMERVRSVSACVASIDFV